MINSKRKVLCLLLLGVLLITYYHRNSSFIIHNDDYNKLSLNLVLTGLLVKCSFFSHNLLLIKSILGFKFYLDPIFKPVQDLNDNDEVIIDILTREKYNMLIATAKRDDSQQQLTESFTYIGCDLYYKSTLNKFVNDKTGLIRNIDIFDGIEEVRPYYFKVSLEGGIFGNKKSLSFLRTTNLDYINYMNHLRGHYAVKASGNIKTSSDKFKIFQISDLHFLNGLIDRDTKDFLYKSIKQEPPNLIILNGDLFDFHRFTLLELNSIILNTLNLFIALKIPYVINFGDSDYIDFGKNLQILEFISNLPYCLNSVTESSIHGLTNYNFKIFNEESLIGAISILDSKNNKLKSSQINAIYRFNTALGKDIFKLAFMHYPLPNFRPVGKFKIVGHYNEKGPLKTTTDINYINDFLNLGYNVISASHEHENDGCILHENSNKDVQEQASKEIWLCYSSVAGFQGRTKTDEYDRKLRVFEFSDKTLLSWKISQQLGKSFEHQLIAEKDKSINS